MDCFFEPPLCPPSGKQNKICIVQNQCETKKTTISVPCVPGLCKGCEFEGGCIPYGLRFKKEKKVPVYCSQDGEIKEQKPTLIKIETEKLDIPATTESLTEKQCNRGYECESNVCLENQCINKEEIINIVLQEESKFKKIITKFFCQFFHPINKNKLIQCVIKSVDKKVPEIFLEE